MSIISSSMMIQGGGSGGAISYGTAASQLQQSTGSGGNITINVPTGVANGDLMVMFLCGANTGSGAWTAAGWTNRYDNGTAGSMSVWTKVASSEPASYSPVLGNSTNTAGFIAIIKNASFDAIGTNSTSVPAVAPSVTSSAAGALLLGFYSTSNNNTTWTTPTGMTIFAAKNPGSTPMYNAFSQDIGAGATGTRTSTLGGSTTNPNSILLCLKN